MQEDTRSWAYMKSCPFCGSKDSYLKYNGAKFGRFYYVECAVCGGRTRGICRSYNDIPQVDDHEWDCCEANLVTLLWNRRCSDA